MLIGATEDISLKNISVFLFLLALTSGMGIAINAFGFSALLFIFFVFAACYSLSKPWHGFLATIFSLPFSGIYFNWITGAQIPVQIIPSQFLGILTLIGYLLSGKQLKFTKHDRALFVFFAIAIITSLINYPKILSVDIEIWGGVFRNTAGRSVAQLVGLGLMIGIYFLTVNILTTRQKLNKALKFFLWSAFITAVFAFYQFIGYFFGFPLTNSWYYPALEAVVATDLIGGLPRVGSVAGEPRHLAYNLLPCIFILLPFLLYKSHIFKTKVQPSIFIFAIFVAFIFTFSRSGWIFFIPSFLVFLFLMNFYPIAKNHKPKEGSGKKWQRILAMLVLFPALFVVLGKILVYWDFFLGSIVFERFVSIENALTEDYIENIFLIETLKVAANNLIWGVGLGNSSFYIDVRYYVDVTGTYVRLLSETGVFGLFAFLWFFSGSLIYSVRAIKETPQEENKVIILALAAGVMSFLVIWIYYGQNFINPLIWILIGMLKTSAKLEIENRQFNANWYKQY